MNVQICKKCYQPANNISFNQGNVTRYRELQKQGKLEIKLADCKYKDKVENLLSAGSSRPTWEGVKSMMGMQSKSCPISVLGKPDQVLANELNSFYNRFNTLD